MKIWDDKVKGYVKLKPSLPKGAKNRQERRHLQFSKAEKKQRRKEEVERLRNENRAKAP